MPKRAHPSSSARACPTVSIFEDGKPQAHTHDTSHFDVDPSFIPHRVEPNAFINGAKLLRSSFVQTHNARQDPSSSKKPDRNVIDTSRIAILPTARLNGLVESVIEAHGYRRRLVLSPDEVFAAIVSQFSYLVRYNEDIRKDLWQDPGILQSRLKIEVPKGTTREEIPFSAISSQLKRILLHNLRNKEFSSWVDPSFSTTTETHRLMYVTLLLGQCKSFDPGLLPPAGNSGVNGGIVAATLEGQPEDWEKLHTLITPLKKYVRRWHSMLDSVLDLMKWSYNEPTNPAVRNFWRIATLRDAGRLARQQLSGWLTAFCLWSWNGTPNKEGLGPTLSLRGGHFKRIDNNLIPPIYAMVDIELRQQGEEENGEIDYDDSLAEVLAGVFGTRYRVEEELPQYKCWSRPIAPGSLTGVQPFSAWFMFQVTPEYVSYRENRDMPNTN
ncbi:hypothetical protein KEM54_004653 [Ascosphaera aggregata]|nr:hypothetical protein KEM54_004653 [Ascosphaera aggregata]